MPIPLVRSLAGLCVFLIVAFLALEADTRGRGGGGRGGGRGSMGGFGGGGFSRTGPASTGSFGRGRADLGSRPQTRPEPRPQARPETRPEKRPGDPGDRGDDRQDRIDDRQDHRQDRQDYRRNVYAEHHEYWHDYDEYYEDRWSFAVGASLTAAAFSSLSCKSSPVVVGGVTYYNCGSTWYQRGYTGGNVTYVVVNPPPGH